MTYPSRYTITVREALERIGLLDRVLGEHDTLVLTLRGGSGNYKLFLDGGGSEEMPVFSYHPEGFCEGNGICEWCGRTLFD